jgi:murein DD-endopeptidase MepM/ murein hydrolase activator NlpD
VAEFIGGAEAEKIFDSIPLCKPVAANAFISLRFGRGRDPFTGHAKLHNGVDIAAPPGTAVMACAAGRVVSVENGAIWGRRVVIEHSRGFQSVYAHLGTVSVARGRPVRRGGTIGTIGSSGLATGPHVHYEVRRNGEPLDPELFFYPLAAPVAADSP